MRPSTLSTGRVLCLVLTAAAALGTGTPARAQVSPECGVQCVFAVLNYYDRSSLLDNLILKHVTSPKGSSIEDLVIAIESHGLHAYPVKNLTRRNLLQSPYPIILHVRGQAGAAEFDHYQALFPGSESSGFALYEPPDHIAPFAYANLAPRWRGWGIIVSPHPINVSEIYPRSPWRFAGPIVAAFAFLIPAAFVLRRASLRQPSYPALRPIFHVYDMLTGGAVIGALSCTLALLAMMRSESFLSSADAVAAVRSSHFEKWANRVTASQVRDAMNSGALVVDARYTSDFDAGHIQGAISLPPSTTPERISRTLNGIPTDRTIVVYCQSRSCPFSGVVGRNLYDLGYRNLALYANGWVEWESLESRGATSPR